MHFTTNAAVLALAFSSALAAPQVKRGEKGAPQGGAPQGGPTCSNGAIFCDNGNKEFFSKDAETACAGGSTYCCSSSGDLSVLNCANGANSNDVSIPISLLSKRGYAANEGEAKGDHGPEQGGDTCSNGSVFCNNGNDEFFSKNSYTDCTGGSTYCCSSHGDGSIANCANAASGNKIDIPLSLMFAKRSVSKRNDKPKGPPPQQSTCSNGAVMCNNGNKGWFSKDDETYCEGGSTYCCQSSGDLSIANCANAANNNKVTVDLSTLLGGGRKVRTTKRNDGGEKKQPAPQGGSTCSNGAVVCGNGNKSFYSSDNETGCQGGSTYCCESSGTLSILNCANVASGNSVSLSIRAIV